ncbi:MAG: glycosyltransferase family 39 protein, partial [Anaerolineae bacterium]|nr:glycosyltransferase family 39 protein [Anaerolineae bacterium]
MSSDVDNVFNSMDSLFWNPENHDLQQQYRLLDAPLTRYLIGIARQLFNQPGLENDWNWSLSWEQNQSMHAYPNRQLLWISRLSVAWLSIFSLIFFFDFTRQLTNPLLAFLASLYLAFNPLFLLHTRRAMAESALLFFSILSVWLIIRFARFPVLIGLGCALAFCAKQSAIFLLIPAVYGTTFLISKPLRLKQEGIILFQLFVTFGLTIFILNPFMWKDPIQAINASFEQRVSLTQQQTNQILLVSPEKQTDSFPQKMAALLGALFFQEPAVA